MNIFKETVILAGIVASISCFSVSAVNASLWSYKKGDVNDSGSVEMADLASLQQVLNGVRTASSTTIERLDLNNDYVIDAYDRSQLSDILFGVSSTSTEFYEFTSDLPSMSNIEYYVCSPSTGLPNYDLTYSLSPVNDLNNLPNPPRTILDGDDRYVENGLDGVINVQHSNGSNAGTAFVIDAHTLLTAAHVVYGEANLQFKIFTNYNTQSNIQITPVKYHVPSAYVNDSDGWKYDYAIVTVQQDLSNYNNHNYINFDLGLMRDEMSHTKPVYVTGFGGDGANVSPSLVNVKSTGIGTLLNTPVSSKDYAINFNTDIIGGDSGGPVYVKNTDGTNSVIAICTYNGPNYNSGRRITSDVLRFVFNNPNLQQNS